MIKRYSQTDLKTGPEISMPKSYEYLPHDGNSNTRGVTSRPALSRMYGSQCLMTAGIRTVKSVTLLTLHHRVDFGSSYFSQGEMERNCYTDIESHIFPDDQRQLVKFLFNSYTILILVSIFS